METYTWKQLYFIFKLYLSITDVLYMLYKMHYKMAVLKFRYNILKNSIPSMHTPNFIPRDGQRSCPFSGIDNIAF